MKAGRLGRNQGGKHGLCFEGEPHAKTLCPAAQWLPSDGLQVREAGGTLTVQTSHNERAIPTESGWLKNPLGRGVRPVW